jgi:hypothetical protein
MTKTPAAQKAVRFMEIFLWDDYTVIRRPVKGELLVITHKSKEA